MLVLVLLKTIRIPKRTKKDFVTIFMTVKNSFRFNLKKRHKELTASSACLSYLAVLLLLKMLFQPKN